MGFDKHTRLCLILVGRHLTTSHPISQMSIQGYFGNYTNEKYGSGSRIIIHPSKCVLCWAWKRAKSGERWPAPTRQIPVWTVQRVGSVWITTNSFFPFYIDFFSVHLDTKNKQKKTEVFHGAFGAPQPPRLPPFLRPPPLFGLLLLLLLFFLFLFCLLTCELKVFKNVRPK